MVRVTASVIFLRLCNCVTVSNYVNLNFNMIGNKLVRLINSILIDSSIAGLKACMSDLNIKRYIHMTVWNTLLW